MSMRPLVLFSNDDGILSPHLDALATAVEEAGIAEALVVAPERQRSAASHAITLHKPLRLHEVKPRRFSLSGTPVDCVYVGLLKLAARAPALVVSGINDGYNLGSDVFYSGTVAAAIEGGLRGVPAMALSMAHDTGDSAAAVAFSVALIRAAVTVPMPEGLVLNVNMPGLSSRRYRWTTLGRRYYGDDVTERDDPRGRPYYWIGGGSAGSKDLAGSDCNAIAEGSNSVTPMHLDLTDHGRIQGEPLWALDGFELG
jgi:5'/3'-nucleotidase